MTRTDKSCSVLDGYQVDTRALPGGPPIRLRLRCAYSSYGLKRKVGTRMRRFVAGFLVGIALSATALAAATAKRSPFVRIFGGQTPVLLPWRPPERGLPVVVQIPVSPKGTATPFWRASAERREGVGVLHPRTVGGERFEQTPYMVVSSPERQCGKSRLMELTEFLTPRPWYVIMQLPNRVWRRLTGAE